MQIDIEQILGASQLRSHANVIDFFPGFDALVERSNSVMSRRQIGMGRGLALNSRTLKVLRAVAELEDISVTDLLDRIVLEVFEGKLPFSGNSLETIQKLKAIYGLAPQSFGASVRGTHKSTD